MDVNGRPGALSDSKLKLWILRELNETPSYSDIRPKSFCCNRLAVELLILPGFCNVSK